MTNYKIAKQELKETSKHVKKHYPNDKPLIRQCINDKAYFLQYNLTPYQIELLQNYACKLQP
jgi:hypothetical protein